MRRRRLAWICTVLLTLSLCASMALAQPTAEVHRNRVLELLKTPVKHTTKRQWMGLGEAGTTNQMLVELVHDTGVPKVFQVRAVQAMAFFATLQSKQFLWQVVYDRRLEDVFKTAALTSLGGAFQEDVLLELAGFLHNNSEGIRRGAIIGLGMIHDPRVRSMLESYLPQEQNIDLRILIEHSLERVRAWEKSEDVRRKHEILRSSNPPDPVFDHSAPGGQRP